MLCGNLKWRKVELPSIYLYPIVEDHTPSIRCACAVIKQAKEDLYLPANHASQSLSWFLSPSFEAYSFLWLCFHLDIQPERIIRELAPRIRQILAEL